MLSELANLYVLISIILSFFLIFFSFRELKLNLIKPTSKIINLSRLQLSFTIMSFIILLLGYLFSDFSIINVYENSHSTKPLLSGLISYLEKFGRVLLL